MIPTNFSGPQKSQFWEPINLVLTHGGQSTTVPHTEEHYSTKWSALLHKVVSGSD